MSSRPTVVITGVAGHLGQSLLQLLPDFSVIGVDVRPPAFGSFQRFETLDLGRESSCQALVEILQQSRATAVVHLAFVLDQVRTGILDLRRMWQINVAGTARVMEAITEVNRSRSGVVTKFIFPSSVSAYGPEFPHLVKEDQPLGAHTLPYAVQKQETDDVVRLRAASLGRCATYILRPHIYAGAQMQNYMIGVLRGVPGGRGRLAERLRARGKRLPLLLPKGDRYLGNRFQFVHVDDVARLIAWILRRPEHGRELHVLNVAGRGDPISLQTAARIAGQKIVRLPSRAVCRWALELAWSLGISDIPPQALPYMLGSCVMDTRRLRAFLGSDYDQVIRYSSQAALAESFASAPDSALSEPAATSA
jgi:nucleoside-diphosphate-sugar epimerase